MTKLITPRKLKGFWELMPNEQIKFDNMISALKNVFDNNCFLPLDTPVAEYSEILLAKSGGDVDKEIYRFTKGNTDMCLRYDLTVPLARFVAMNINVLEFPFKRYQVGKVYRGEKPQKGRFREFYQCDADIIGENLSMTADAECIKLYQPCFDALGMSCVVEISNRKILAGFFESIDKSENLTDLMIIVDKVDKLPKEDIYTMLKEFDLSSEDCRKLFEIISCKGRFADIYNKLKDLTDNNTFQQGLDELKILSQKLNAMGMQEENYTFNLSIVRGHNYYTGTVFEAYIKGHRELGAIGGGGRYDNLCGNFLDKIMQGVGMSIGLTRLFDIISQQNAIESTSNIEIGILAFDETFDEGLKIINRLRNNGIKADNIGENKSFKAKMKEADRRNIPFILVVGQDELDTNIYTLKNMKTSEQEKLSLDEIIAKLKK